MAKLSMRHQVVNTLVVTALLSAGVNVVHLELSTIFLLLPILKESPSYVTLLQYSVETNACLLTLLSEENGQNSTKQLYILSDM